VRTLQETDVVYTLRDFTIEADSREAVRPTFGRRISTTRRTTRAVPWLRRKRN
jgi:hypothetical protein